MFCRLCGKEATEDARYCEKCGTKLPEQEETRITFEKSSESVTSQVEASKENLGLNDYKQESEGNSIEVEENRTSQKTFENQGYSDVRGSYNEEAITDYANNNASIKPMESIPDYLVWAVLSIFCCCVPFSIIAIVYSSKVNSALSKGDIEEAKIKSEKAKNWTLAAYICGIIYILIVLIFIMLNT